MVIVIIKIDIIIYFDQTHQNKNHSQAELG